MKDCTLYVGLDYHQSSVQVCAMAGSGKLLLNRSCENNWAAIADAAEAHGRVRRAAIESCAGAADLADELVAHAGWSMDLAHPGYVQRMKGSPDKTDFTDARMLADLERVGYLPKVWLAPHDVRELRRVVRFRQTLVAERRNIKLRIGALLRDQRLRCPDARPWTKGWLEWLRSTESVSPESRWVIDRYLSRMAYTLDDLTAVEDRLAQLTQNDPLVAALQGLQGIGPVTSWTIRAEIGRFDRFRTGKQLARFCGLTPRNASSGTRVADAGLIKAGNRQLRATLIEAAQRLIRMDSEWKALASKLLKRGKPKCVVIAAVANRWVRWLFHRMQPDQLTA